MKTHGFRRLHVQLLAAATLAVVLFLSACNLGAVGGVPTNPRDNVDEMVRQTFAAMTQAVGPAVDPNASVDEAQQTVAAQTQVAQAVAQTVAAMVSATPEFSLTPTFTLTPQAVRVSVTVETNCRSGPGPAYNKLGIVRAGESAEVLGRNSVNDTWIVKLPSNPTITCWLWGQYAKVTGNWEALPVFP